MAKRRARDLSVGAIFALALIILAITVMAVGEESRLLAKKTTFRVVFPNTEGLTVGSPVKMAGVQIGTVTAIRLPTDPESEGIEVQLGIDRSYAERVREDSRAALRIMLYLTGEKAVEIIPGSPSAPALEPGSEIALLEETELFEQVGVASQNLSDITVSLKRILTALERGEGLMGQMITDPEFGQAGLAALRGSFENLERLTGDILAGRGAVGRLMYDETLAARLDDMGRVIEGLSRVVAAIDPEAGALGALLKEDGPGEQAVEDLREAAASLRRITTRLEAGEGLLGQLIYDTQFSENVAADLATALRNAAEITEKVNSGEGTLGALVNERTLHDGMEDVVAGVNDSKFARWLLRHYQKKGIKVRTSEAESDPASPPGTEDHDDGN